MKSLHAIPTEFKSVREAKKASYELPQIVLRGISHYLATRPYHMLKVSINLNQIGDEDEWSGLWFSYRRTQRYARWRYMSSTTIMRHSNEWIEGVVDSDRLEITYAS